VDRARVVLITRDLMFGSKVEAMAGQAGFDCLISAEVPERGDGDALWIVDLAQGDFQPDEVAGRGAPVLAFFSHVDDEMRLAAKAAGLDQLVPRSRMARDGVELIRANSRE
jgi:hypothetical protein